MVEPVWTHPPLQLGENQKLFAVNADYRKSNRGKNWYYVRAKDSREARAIFKEYVTWLDIYEVKEVTDEALVAEILGDLERFICF